MTKVFISPSPDVAPHGIGRVIEAMFRYLPGLGIELVGSEAEADVVNAHSLAFVETDKPVVYTSHGLHWAEQLWPIEYVQANQMMIDYMRRSQAIVGVSEWVSQAIRRGLNRPVETIYHGIDSDDWQPIASEQQKSYVLWNKARADAVCDPREMQKLADMMPDTFFVTTIGDQRQNVQVLGVIPHDQMRQAIEQAGVYLVTTRETFGIGTLEALACGVPVVGWDFGGQSEIFEDHGGAVLVPHGDYEALAAAVRQALNGRSEYSTHARETAEAWSWQRPMQQYARLFERVAAEAKINARATAVSVIVTAYNMERYLEDCLNSVMVQDGDWECLIIDDCSTDDTGRIAARFVGDKRFFYTKTPQNLKLSGARNWAREIAVGRYILYLDGDDMLAPNALAPLSAALDADPSLHIVYGHLRLMSEDGQQLTETNWPFSQFDWYGQMAQLNQLPYCAMMRREVLEHLGGQRQRDRLAEDAAFWCRATSFGFTARKVTQEPMLHYRIRPDSKSATERRELGNSDGNWTAWYPWRTALNVKDGIRAMQEGKRPIPHLVPFGAQGRRDEGLSWPVWSHHSPLVSVVIPVGPKHEHLLVDALDSLIAQDFPFWEAVVVNDTGAELNLPYAPWARVVDCNLHNIAAARNAGVGAAKGKLILFLDADDFLLPTAVREMVSAFVDSDGAKYVYTDWIAADASRGTIEKKESKPYNRRSADASTHAITVLVDKAWIVEVGGFNEDCPGWEDWEFFVKLAVNGFCGLHLPRPLFVYRMHTGERREQSLAIASETLPFLRERYAPFFTGERPMAGCCGGGGEVVIAAKQSLGMLPSSSIEAAGVARRDGMIRIEYLGGNKGPIRLNRAGGVDLSKEYLAGNNPLNKYHDAPEADAEALVATGKWRAVERGGADVDLGGALVDQTNTNQPQDGDDEETAPVADDKPIDVSGTVSEVKKQAAGASPSAIKGAIEAEKAGQNRTTLISALETLLADAERVG